MPTGILGNALFADGAAAIVAGQAVNGRTPVCHAEGTASCLIEDSKETITWDVGNHGIEMSLSSRVPELDSRATPALAFQLA